MHTKGFVCCSGWSVILILDRLNPCGKLVLSDDPLKKECSRPGNRTYKQTNVRLDTLATVLTRLAVKMCSLILFAQRAPGGRTGLMVRASDSGSGDPGSILGRVGVFVSLSKRHLLPKSTGNTQE